MAKVLRLNKLFCWGWRLAADRSRELVRSFFAFFQPVFQQSSSYLSANSHKSRASKHSSQQPRQRDQTQNRLISYLRHQIGQESTKRVTSSLACRYKKQNYILANQIVKQQAKEHNEQYDWKQFETFGRWK
jgi:hypothetical protein